MRSFALVWLSALLLSTGCATGDDGPGSADGGPGGEGGPADAGTDDGGDDGGSDAGGPLECPTGQHLCGGGCIDDQPNEPDSGCRLGCGEPCPTSEFEIASCTEDGACTLECEPPAVRDGDDCVCAPDTCEDLGAMCGTLEDGCGGTLECGACEEGTECVDGACSCPPDAGEPNDNRLVPHGLPDFTDRPDTSMTFDGFAISSEGDEDWYEFQVTDACCDGNPDVDVRLRGIPAGSDYDLALYYVCSSGGDGSSCTRGAVDNMIGRGCSSASSGTTEERVTLSASCSGTNESGTAYIRVTAASWARTCAPYELQITVE